MNESIVPIAGKLCGILNYNQLKIYFMMISFIYFSVNENNNRAIEWMIQSKVLNFYGW